MKKMTDFPLTLPQQLSSHLRSFRRSMGMTQAELGARIGLSQVRIADIEARPQVVSIGQLLTIFAVLQVDLIMRKREPPSTEPAKGEW